MSDPKDTATSAESVVVETGTTAAPGTKPKGEDAEPHWLNARLERERASMLKKLGFESVEDAQATATEIKAKREAEKTLAEKAAETSAALKKAQSKEKALNEAVSVFANSELAGLTDEQKAAVALIAGEDPAHQLKAIAALRPTWAVKAAEVKAEPVKAVDTAPKANAPSQITTSETDKRAQYESLQKVNPFAAAAFGLAHAADVFGNGT